MAESYALFDTALGVAALAWTAAGVCGSRLPEADAALARKAARRRFASAAETAPPSSIGEAIARIQGLLTGEPDDLTSVGLDLSAVGPFELAVYAITRAIPPGETLTYGQIAEQMGDKHLARRIGQALGRNPVPIIVPCHRVLAANGGSGGFSAPGGVATKMKLLAIEKARRAEAPLLFDDLPLATRA